jgi:hypothetical protein
MMHQRWRESAGRPAASRRPKRGANDPSAIVVGVGTERGLGAALCRGSAQINGPRFAQASLTTEELSVLIPH